MKKKIVKSEKTKDKLRFLKTQIEDGLPELGKDENMNLEATVFLKERKIIVDIPFVQVMQPFAEQFSKYNLSQKTHRVLWYLISLIQYENFISIDIDTIIENMGNVSKSSVIRAIKELGELNIVKTVPYVNDKRRNEYFINPYTMWKGSWNDRQKKIKDIRKNSIVLELPFSFD